MADVNLSIGVNASEAKAGIAATEAEMKRFQESIRRGWDKTQPQAQQRAYNIKGGSQQAMDDALARNQRLQAQVAAVTAKTRPSVSGGGMLSSVTGAAGALGIGLSVGAVVSGFQNIVSEGDKIGDLAQRFGIAAAGLQRISFAAAQNEGDLDSVAKAMNRLILSQDKIANGNEEGAKALDALGISAETFVGLNSEEAFYAIADGVKNAEDRTAAYHAVITLLGKSSGNLFTTLQMGAEGIKAQAASIGIYSDKALENFDRIDKAQRKLGQTIKVGVADAITKLMDNPLLALLPGGLAAAAAVPSKSIERGDNKIKALIAPDDTESKSAAREIIKDRNTLASLDAKADALARSRSFIGESDEQKSARIQGDIAAKEAFINRESELLAKTGRANISEVGLAEKKVELQELLNQSKELGLRLSEKQSDREAHMAAMDRKLADEQAEREAHMAAMDLQVAADKKKKEDKFEPERRTIIASSKAELGLGGGAMVFGGGSDAMVGKMSYQELTFIRQMLSSFKPPTGTRNFNSKP